MPVRAQKQDRVDAGRISCLGANYLSTLREAVFAEPQAAGQMFAVPRGGLAYTLGQMPDMVVRKVAEVGGGLPYTVGHELSNTSAMTAVNTGGGMHGVTLAIEEIYARNEVDYEPRWRAKSLLQCLQHWCVASRFAQDDATVATLLFNLHSQKFAEQLADLTEDQLANLTLATWGYQPLQDACGLRAAIGFAAAGAATDRVIAFRVGGASTAFR